MKFFSAVADRTLLESQDIFSTVADFFLKLGSSQRPLFLVIDDIQWLDEGSRKVLARFSGAIERSNLLILCSARSDRDNADALARFATDLASSLGARLPIRSLSETETAQVVSQQLGEWVIDANFSQQIYRKSNGSPLAIGVYVRAMLDSGFLRPHWRRWQVDWTGIEQLNLPTDVVQLILRRIGLLSDSCKSILRTAAMIGTHFSIPLLARASDAASAEALQSRLEEAVLANLLEAEGRGQFSFVHDRVLEALASELTETEQRRIHQNIAEALEQDQASDDANPIFTLARHYGLGEWSKIRLDWCVPTPLPGSRV